MVVTSTKEKSSKATSGMANALVARHIGVEIHVCHVPGMVCHNFLAMVHANISTRISVVIKSWFPADITVGSVWNIPVGGRMQ